MWRHGKKPSPPTILTFDDIEKLIPTMKKNWKYYYYQHSIPLLETEVHSSSCYVGFYKLMQLNLGATDSTIAFHKPGAGSI